MKPELQFILSLSILLPLVAGLVRFRVVDKLHHPFIYVLAAGLVVELLRHYLVGVVGRTPVVVILNVYTVVELLLFTWLFFNWSIFKRNKKLFISALILFFGAWVVLTFIARPAGEPNVQFRILLSLTLIFYGVATINKIVIAERGNILMSSKFLICIGIIVFYTLFALVGAAQLSFFGESASIYLLGSMHTIIAYANVFANLLFTLAVLWIPRKKNFINPF